MKAVKTIFVFALALLVLVSSTSFMVGIHFCSGEVADMALFTEAEPCAMEKNLPPCHKQVSNPCCEDKSIVHEGDGFKVSFYKIALSPSTAVDVEAAEVILAEIIPSAPASPSSWYNYDPPLRSYDLTVTHRVFLI